MSPTTIILAVFAYTALLFWIAFRGDRAERKGRISRYQGVIYGLSIAVYCTSWTFYGAVGTAASSGWEYIPIYLGPAVMFSLGLPVIARMVREGKAIGATSIADFLSARYGKSRRIAAMVTAIAAVGALPYIALQLQSVATTFAALSTNGAGGAVAAGGVFVVAAILSAFAILFGARHVDVTAHNRGMINAIAFDSIVKLIALIAVGAFALGALGGALGDGGGSVSPAPADPFAAPLAIDRFITLTFLAMAAVLCLPRQFHVTVVECRNPSSLRVGALGFVFYLLLITIVVVPITQAGMANPAVAGGDPDLFVLALPLAADQSLLALFVFVGGFAAATGMVIVASVALSTMIANDLVAPFMLRGQTASPAGVRRAVGAAFGARLLLVRRLIIVALGMGAAVFAVFAPEGGQLASLGILSFAAAAQFAPALIGGLYWRGAGKAGAYYGLAVGFALWALCLLAPSYLGEANLPAWLQWARVLDFTGWDALTRGVAISLGANGLVFILISVLAPARSGGSVEGTAGRGSAAGPASVAAGELFMLVESCLGAVKAREALDMFETAYGRRYEMEAPADQALIAFAERQLSKAIGASSASILLKGAAGGGALRLEDIATLIDETAGQVNFSRELLQTTLENISHGVSVVNADLELVAWNSAYVEMYDYPPGFIAAGRPVVDLIRYNAQRGECGQGDIEDMIARRIAHLRAGKAHTYERIRPNGMVVKIQGARSPSGAYVTSFTDVTEYKRIEKALRESERAIRFYTDNVPSMIAFSDPEERILFANRAYRVQFGDPERDITGAPLNGLLSAEAYAQRKPFIDQALAGRRTVFDTELEDPAGARRFMQVTYVPQLSASGAIRGFFGIYQDVTARREAENALARTNETLEERVAERTRALSSLNLALDEARREAEAATASKTRFLAAASHDVLQPLNAARLFASALKEETAGLQAAASLTDKIDASIASADRLLRALLNVSKFDAGGVVPEVTAFPLNALFEELENEFRLAAMQKGLQLRRVDTGLWVKSDRGLLLSALQNLVSNAVRYTDAGKVLIGARRRGERILIGVFDTGRGIPEDRQADIFEEFKRLPRDTAISGAGLGLATVDRIASLLEMPLALVSSPERGSAFTLLAERADARAQPIAQTTKTGAPLLKGRKVLCIDNEASVREALEALLSRWGAQVLTASSGAAAEACYAAGAEPPQFVIIDYQLDDGETGFDALDALASLWGRVPDTIMITASSSGEAEIIAAARGVPVLTKPVEPAELRAALSQMAAKAAE